MLGEVWRYSAPPCPSVETEKVLMQRQAKWTGEEAVQCLSCQTEGHIQHSPWQEKQIWMLFFSKVQRDWSWTTWSASGRYTTKPRHSQLAGLIYVSLHPPPSQLVVLFESLPVCFFSPRCNLSSSRFCSKTILGKENLWLTSLMLDCCQRSRDLTSPLNSEAHSMTSHCLVGLLWRGRWENQANSLEFLGGKVTYKYNERRTDTYEFSSILFGVQTINDKVCTQPVAMMAGILRN